MKKIFKVIKAVLLALFGIIVIGGVIGSIYLLSIFGFAVVVVTGIVFLVVEYVRDTNDTEKK